MARVIVQARYDMPDETARQLTQAVFEHRLALAAKVRRLRDITERFDAHHNVPARQGAVRSHGPDDGVVLSVIDDLVTARNDRKEAIVF